LQRLLPLQRLNITPEIIAKPNHRRASDVAHQACKLTAWGKPYDVSAQNDSALIVPTLFRLAEYHPVGKAKIPQNENHCEEPSQRPAHSPALRQPDTGMVKNQGIITISLAKPFRSGFCACAEDIQKSDHDDVQRHSRDHHPANE
jgi:hypothetical protein